MTEIDLAYLSIEEASGLIKSLKLSPVDLTQACLARIERLNPSLNAFITVTAELALEAARDAESQVRGGGWRGPLHGIPIALKDLIDVAGIRTTAGCAVFKERVAREDAAVTQQLKQAGAVLLGKTNLHEIAFGGTSATSYFGAVKNPWDRDRIAGGSSGGSAAAVAAGLCLAALGTDTGGSIREPASFCGIVGLKPTYGRISARGVMPLSRSLDHLGPLARSVTDAALVLDVIAEPAPDEAAAARVEGVRGLRLGVPAGLFHDNLDAEVGDCVAQAVRMLQGLGGEVRPVLLPISTDRVIIRAEAYAYHSRHVAESPLEYRPDTLEKLRRGAAISQQVYAEALEDLVRLRQATAALFDDIDILITPTVPVPPPKFTDIPTDIEGMLAVDALVLQNTRPFNLNGLPCLSLPFAATRDGLPVGVHLSAAPWGEAQLLSAARGLEREIGWRVRRFA